MSERQEVEVLLPVERIPTRQEHAQLMRTAWESARQLVVGVGGRVIGLASVARGETLLGQLALKVRFLVIVPEKTVERPTAISVPTGKATS